MTYLLVGGPMDGRTIDKPTMDGHRVRYQNADDPTGIYYLLTKLQTKNGCVVCVYDDAGEQRGGGHETRETS